MDVIISNQDGCVVAAVEGRVDTTTAKDFELKVCEVLKGDCSNVVLDCAGLTYVSSSGLRVFLILQKSIMAKKGKLTIKSMSEPIKEVFKITGFLSIFTIE